MFCVAVEKSYDYVFMVCLKSDLLRKDELPSLNLEYRWYESQREFTSSSLEQAQDCLATVPGSVGCHVKYDNVREYLPLLRDANGAFVELLRKRRCIQTHGTLTPLDSSHIYQSTSTGRFPPNPVYNFTEEEYQLKMEKREETARNSSNEELSKRVIEPRQPCQTIVTTGRFFRNPSVAEYVRRAADGVCQGCHEPAPFVSKTTGEPFLEIHHIKSLADGGADIIENTTALCPNCHRERHYGQ